MRLVSIWSMFTEVSIRRFWLYLGSFVRSESFKDVVNSFQIFLGLGTILKNWVEIWVHFRILKTVMIGLEIGNLIDVSFYLKDQGSNVLKKISQENFHLLTSEVKAGNGHSKIFRRISAKQIKLFPIDLFLY